MFLDTHELRRWERKILSEFETCIYDVVLDFCAIQARIRKGINVLVATPGRLVDHLRTTACLNLSHCRYLVMDEADRLMDLGFEKDISMWDYEF